MPFASLPDVQRTDFSAEPPQWRDLGLVNICITLRGMAELLAERHIDDTVFVASNPGAKQ